MLTYYQLLIINWFIGLQLITSGLSRHTIIGNSLTNDLIWLCYIRDMNRTEAVRFRERKQETYSVCGVTLMIHQLAIIDWNADTNLPLNVQYPILPVKAGPPVSPANASQPNYIYNKATALHWEENLKIFIINIQNI